MKVLVTGAAGYIGSHALRALVRAGHGVVALDNLSRGHRGAVQPQFHVHEIDVRNTEAVRRLLEEERVDGVMHFAALSEVGESVREPLRYFENNVAGTLSLLRAVDLEKVRRFVFSSTCATYGEPTQVPIPETTPQFPISPYGTSKLVSELMLADYARSAPDFGYAALRYFNVAGAGEGIGEDHRPESHLVPLAIQAALGHRDSVTVFGDDYPTPDGTCTRDYIHVEDLVEAHVAVLEALEPGDRRTYNIGAGRGISVREVIEAVERVTGRHIEVRFGARRQGDPPILFADASKICVELGWKPMRSFEEMIDSACKWHAANPLGYGV